MKELLMTTAADMRTSISHYIEQLMFGAYIKAALAAVATLFIDVLYGDIVVFNIYIAFACCDLLLGIVRAKVYGNYHPKYVLYWIRKLMTYMCLVVILGLLCHSFFRTSGVIFSAVNWLLFCCTLTEGASVVDNLRRLGCPIHPFIDKVMKLLRKQAVKNITRYVEDPEMRREFEEALEHARSKNMEAKCGE